MKCIKGNVDTKSEHFWYCTTHHNLARIGIEFCMGAIYGQNFGRTEFTVGFPVRLNFGQ